MPTRGLTKKWGMLLNGECGMGIGEMEGTIWTMKLTGNCCVVSLVGFHCETMMAFGARRRSRQVFQQFSN